MSVEGGEQGGAHEKGSEVADALIDMRQQLMASINAAAKTADAGTGELDVATR